MASQTVEELDTALRSLSDEYPGFTSAHRQVLTGVHPDIVKEALSGTNMLGERNRWLLALLVRDYWPDERLRSTAQEIIHNFLHHSD